MITAGVLTLLAGFLVGATTLGGVLVVPALTTFAAVQVDRAVAAASLAMLAPALLAAQAAWSHAEPQNRRTALLVTVASAIGALTGASALGAIPASFTIGLLALLALAGGIRGLLSRPTATTTDADTSIPVVSASAAAAGIVSAVTGTGGPVALWPILRLAGQPLAACWIAALAIQLPVALGASAGNIGAGRLDFELAAIIAVLMTAGFVAGRRVANRAGVERLGQATSVMLILVALWMFATILG